MTGISVRKLDEETLRRLKLQAARHGVSMEEEVRRILARGVGLDQSVGEMAEKVFGDIWRESEAESFEVPSRDINDPPRFD